ncbi:hypothetical protein P7K49_021272, partial [Saguinus oedipus]
MREPGVNGGSGGAASTSPQAAFVNSPHFHSLFCLALFLCPTGDREYIRDLKEKCCYVALDFDKEKKKTSSPPRQWKYQLPDGQEISVGQESFLCPEVLFQTELT